MDQKEILLKFLNVVKSKRCDKQENIAGEFLRLKRQSTKFRNDKIYLSSSADKQENVKKNRYKDIVPFDHSRVKLSLIISDNDSDYINGNFIKGVYGPQAYIATQGPLPHTVMDFWRMLWEYNVSIVIMACREFEMGRKKCERYWAYSGEDPCHYGPFSVTCEKETNKSEYIVRILKVQFQSMCRTVHQLHYMNWADHDVPSSIDPILDMITDMRLLQHHDDIPICIHCSAGCGRTGVICAIDYTWKLLKDGIIPENFHVYNLIQEMRTQRPSIVQTKEQYELVYSAITYLFENQIEFLNTNMSLNQDLVKVTVLPPPNPTLDSTTSLQLHRSPKKEQGSQLMDEAIAPFSPAVQDHRLNLCLDRHNTSCGLVTDICRNHNCAYVNEQTEVSLCSGQLAIEKKLERHLSLDTDSTEVSQHSELLFQEKKNTINNSPSATRSQKSCVYHHLEDTKESFEVKQNLFCASQELQNIKCNSSVSPVEKSWHSCDWEHDQEKKILLAYGAETQYCVHVNSNIQSAWTHFTEDPYFTSPCSADLCPLELLSSSQPLHTHPSVTAPKDLSQNEHDAFQIPVSFSELPSRQNTAVKQLHDPSEMECKKKNNAVDSDEETPPALPERTPESYILPEQLEQPQASFNKQTPAVTVKIGTSSEWCGVSQPKSFLESMNLMSRSKS
ncbi:tyrosine-protein phosphatase non-receptor type 22 isoform X2 [Callorhinchus milii]|nr:tyrosine-protein phosphatase non-receptor type 22 isoform X2 [Callorhinchus milii]|eukprot:gi/632962902/ref/XP_007897585.1/ PREDICTED: tyrosine-protein phosphatase non-receptor type 22 isoform X2 [Callorhinchus milii]